VPNLWELLTPAKQRKGTSWSAAARFGPQKVGYDTEHSPSKNAIFVADLANANGTEMAATNTAPTSPRADSLGHRRIYEDHVIAVDVGLDEVPCGSQTPTRELGVRGLLPQDGCASLSGAAIARTKLMHRVGAEQTLSTPHHNRPTRRRSFMPFDSRHRHSGDPEVHGAKEVPGW